MTDPHSSLVSRAEQAVEHAAAEVVAPRHYPLSFIVMEVLGVLCLLVSVACFIGIGADLNPLLADSGTGIALLVTAISLIISGIFPLVLRRLAEQDAARNQ